MPRGYKAVSCARAPYGYDGTGWSLPQHPAFNDAGAVSWVGPSCCMVACMVADEEQASIGTAA